MVIEKNIKDIIQGIKDDVIKLQDSTILITGGAGFLGKNIVWTLQELNKNHNLNCKVIVVDNYVTGLENEFRENNITCIKHDITKKLIIDEDIDYIMHAAGIASPIFYTKYKLETIEVSIQGTQNILEMAKEKKSKGV